MAAAGKTYYRETQRFTQVWLWLVFLGIAGLLWYGFVQQIVLGIPFGSKPASNTVLLVFWLLFGVGLPVLFYGIRLIVEVREEGVYVHFFPMRGRLIPYEQIQACQVRTFKPILDFGGWGIRWMPLRGWAYIVKGNQGIELQLGPDEWLMLGSQSPEQVAGLIQERMKKA